MRVLHVITSLRTGGAEKLMVDLLPRLQQSGHEIDLLLFDGIETSFKRILENKGIKIYNLGVGGSVYSPLRLFKFLPYLRCYDIVHTHNTAPQMFAALGSVWYNVKLITTEHNTSNRRRKWKWYKVIDRCMYNRYRTVICISKKAEQNLLSYIGSCKANIQTVENGIDLNNFIHVKSSENLEKIAPNSKKIIMVAGFRPQKDQDTLIRSIKLLPSDFHLFLVGDGTRRKELEDLTSIEGIADRVHFMGIRDDIPELLHAADYIVMSSHFEGLSLSSVEGMCAGKPFIASDVDGLRDVVYGAGILFPHEDAKTLADEIMKLEKNPPEYKVVANRCLERAKHYDISKMSRQYDDIYKSSLFS